MKFTGHKRFLQFIILSLQFSFWITPTSGFASKISEIDCMSLLLKPMSFWKPPIGSRWRIDESLSDLENSPRIELGTHQLEFEIKARRSRVSEFHFIREEAQKRGLRVWLFGGTAAAFSHYVKWDLLREQGDSRFQPDRFDYDYTNVFRSTQDLDLVVDGGSEAAEKFERVLKQTFPYFLGSKIAEWEVRSLREPKIDKGSLLHDYGFMNQHTDSNSTGMVELTDPLPGESVIRDIRSWDSIDGNPFLNDLNKGKLTFYYSSKHGKTPRAKAGKNPPIFSVIRALTKAFQYNLRIEGDDLIVMKKIIDQFNPKIDLKDSYASHWLEKNGIKLLQHAVDLEYAWNTLEKLGLRAQLISVRDQIRLVGSLSWWLNKEPLRGMPIGTGTGRTAESLGLKTVAHETMSFLAYESITRSHTGAPNVFISRSAASGENASYGDGFYTSLGKRGARGSGITIRFNVDPRAREGTDFILSSPDVSRSNRELPDGIYVIWRNKNALRVIPESLNLSPFEYFDFLAKGQEIKPEDQALLWKLKRKIDQSLISGKVPSEELDKIHFLVLEHLNLEHLSKDQYRSSSSILLLQEWIKFQAKRLQISENQVNASLESLATGTYLADPVPLFEFFMNLARNTPIEKYFSDIWLPSVLSTIKLDIGNRTLERCLFSTYPRIRDFGKYVLSKRKIKTSQLFDRALQGILDSGGDLKYWLKIPSKNRKKIQEKVAYLALHPELRYLIDQEEWEKLEFQFKKVTQIQIFEDLSNRTWPTGVLSESFQFESFEFPAFGKHVKQGTPSYYSGLSSGEVEVEVVFTQPFQIQRTPVTQFQWAWMMGYNPSRFFRGGQRIRIDNQEIEMNPNYPVENVSWDEVQGYIEKLNSIDQDYEYRLPTDAEWEYAIRGESKTTYHFGNDYTELTEYAWYLGNSMNHTHDVATLKPNVYGLYDVHGNVSEWLQDWWSFSRPGFSINPVGPAMGSYRVVRGGSWADQASNLRTSLRNTQGPQIRGDMTGFRLVRTPRILRKEE